MGNISLITAFETAVALYAFKDKWEIRISIF